MVKKPCPRVGVPFELTLNGDLAQNIPMGVVNAFGYHPHWWKYNGSVITGEQNGWFMLVEVGCQPNLEAVRKAIELMYGVKSEEHRGQWMNAFIHEFEANGVNYIGITDDSWLVPGGIAVFPFISAEGFTNFSRNYHSLDGYWLWLVPAPAPGK